ncbi:AAC(3) family N-acetyltransferase [Hyalangium rubrum]|uniref:Aminoglycoside N(3)-acetyltransferase n=1 Tax=Hyalangium rubrum TaxID=3103134 RepID=A0ABU5HIH2_9BACT|nr:AAC(3) family N-acetyltransferase [Hyalangium sp. s54d21]MDY7233055.1 AAC(3) family N-acetyltransferase [Hyalangium sp. s54d21]
MERPELSRAHVAEQLRALGVREGGVLLVHTSFRAVRPVEGGPLGLISALRDALGPRGTLVLPSSTGDDDTPFDPRTTPAAESLGILPELFWRQPGVLRSNHFGGFASVGPRAAEIISAPLTLPPSSPGSPISVIHALDGQVLLLGVGHGCSTMLHLAEILGGAPYRVPRHYTELRDGRPVRIDYGENDHCCERFEQMDAWLRAAGLQAEGPVGHAPARLVRAQDLVRVAVERLASDPLLFLHPSGAGCEECDEARASVGDI